jgi:hypothetical protein
MNRNEIEELLAMVHVAEETAVSEIAAYGMNYEAYEQGPRCFEAEADAEEAADFEAWFRELYTAEINR